MATVNALDFSFFQHGTPKTILDPAQSRCLESIAREKSGGHRALLLLHGFSSTPHTFKPFIEALYPDYDAVYAPLLPKHGENLAEFSRLTAQELLDFIDALGKKLTEAYHQVDVVGLSLGGVLAHHFCRSFPANNLFLLAPAFALQLPIQSAIALSSLLSNLGFAFLPSKAGNLCADVDELAYRLLPIRTIREILGLIKDYSFSIPLCKTHLFLGRHDAVIDSARVHSLFESSDTQITWLENSAHVLPIDTDKDTIIAAITDAAARSAAHR